MDDIDREEISKMAKRIEFALKGGHLLTAIGIAQMYCADKFIVKPLAAELAKALNDKS